MSEKYIRTFLYVLLIIACIVIVGHLEYQEIQDDIQAQTDCRVQDTEDLTPTLSCRKEAE